MKGNRSNHPKKYVRWDDFESFRLKEWSPFREAYQKWLTNDWLHLTQKTENLGNDMKWVKWLLGLLIAGVIALLIKG